MGRLKVVARDGPVPTMLHGKFERQRPFPVEISVRLSHLLDLEIHSASSILNSITATSVYGGGHGRIDVASQTILGS